MSYKDQNTNVQKQKDKHKVIKHVIINHTLQAVEYT